MKEIRLLTSELQSAIQALCTNPLCHYRTLSSVPRRHCSPSYQYIPLSMFGGDQQHPHVHKDFWYAALPSKICSSKQICAVVKKSNLCSWKCCFVTTEARFSGPNATLMPLSHLRFKPRLSAVLQPLNICIIAEKRGINCISVKGI